MPFQKNTQFAERAGGRFGEYDSTFISEHGEVRAELFRVGESLVGYVSFEEGKKIGEVTDKYVRSLEDHAAAIGLGGKLRLLYTEN